NAAPRIAHETASTAPHKTKNNQNTHAKRAASSPLAQKLRSKPRARPSTAASKRSSSRGVSEPAHVAAWSAGASHEISRLAIEKKVAPNMPARTAESAISVNTTSA